MKEINEALDRCFGLEQQGDIESALDLLKLYTCEHQEVNPLIRVELAKMQFRNGKYFEALLNFAEYLEENEDEEILELVFEAYYIPNKHMYEESLQSNIQILMEYPFCFASLDKMSCREVKILWEDEHNIIIWNHGKIHKYYGVENTEATFSSRLAFVNLIGEKQIILWSNNMAKGEHPNEIIPLYLFYDFELWAVFLQIYHFQELVKLGNLVLFSDRETIKDFFSDMDVYFPEGIGGDEGKEYINLLSERVVQIQKEQKEIRAFCIESNYKDAKEIDANITNGIPKIMFLTSRLTSVLQYHVRDILDAARHMGFETKMIIEKSMLHGKQVASILKEIYEFQPDIVFLMDHFRFEENIIPKQVVVITWIQDPLPIVMDKATPLKLGKRDIVLNHMYLNEELLQLNYKEMIKAPIPASNRVYKINPNVKMFNCDICLVCYASSMKKGIEIALSILSEDMHLVVESFLIDYWHMVKKGDMVYTEKQFGILLIKYMQERNWGIHQEEVDKYIKKIFILVNQRFYRQAVVEWLIEAGFTNIQLWGYEWSEVEKFAPYAMGPAENGTVLAEIYQQSKIVLGNNCSTTAAARVWESMLSGAFYMSNYIPEEYDMANIREVLKEDEEIVIFRDKEDLINKVTYYLNNEDERRAIAEKGRKKVLKEMTYDVLMEKIWKEVQKRSEKDYV